MKTLKEQIEERFNIPFDGHPSREDEYAIKDAKWAILKLAERIDHIQHGLSYNG